MSKLKSNNSYTNNTRSNLTLKMKKSLKVEKTLKLSFKTRPQLKFKQKAKIKMMSNLYRNAEDLATLINRKKVRFFLSVVSKRKVKIYSANKKISLNYDKFKVKPCVKLEKEVITKTNNPFDFFFLNNNLKFLGHNSSDSSRPGLISNIKTNPFKTNEIIFANKKSRVFCSATFFSIRKNKILTNFGFKKQYVYNIFDSILALKEDFSTLTSRETLNSYFSVFEAKREYGLVYFFRNYMHYSLFNFAWTEKHKINNTKIFILNHNKFIFNLLYTVIYINSLYSNQNENFYKVSTALLCGSDLNETSIVKNLLRLNISGIYNANANILSRKITYNTLFNQSSLNTVFNKSNANILNLKNSNYILNFVKQNFIETKLNVSNYIWKKSFIKQNKFFSYSKKRGFGWEKKHNPYARELSKGILFLLSKIYEKEKFIEQDSVAHKDLLNLKDLLASEISEKIKKQKTQSLILSRRLVVRSLRKKRWMYSFLKQLSKEVENLNTSNIQESKFFRTSSKNRKKRKLQSLSNEFISKNRVLNRVVLNTFKEKKSSAYKIDTLYNLKLTNTNDWMRRKNVRKKALWKEKKLVQSGLNPKFNQLNKFFSFLFKNSTSLFFVNALSLTKFAFVYPLKKKSVHEFLNRVEREMIKRYKYVAVYIQDLVRVSFLSLFLKKPAFLASFIGFQIAKLPKNRKETKLVRFIIKVVKVFSSQRKEMIGLKIEFKGRVNRWRRTKIIRGISGAKILLPLYSYDTRIEFGSGKAITRKGALGIRLWLCYRPSFEGTLSEAMLSYVEYSQRLKAKAVKRFLNKFKTKSKLC